MRSKLPKVLQPLAGKPLLQHVIERAQKLAPEQLVVVYGHGGEAVKQRLGDLPVEWVEQREQLGTGHAVAQALPVVDKANRVLVLYGDVPLINAENLQQFLHKTSDRQVGLLTAIMPNPQGYGRILRDHGEVVGIVEQKDAAPEQLAINEINTGILSAEAKDLERWLANLKNDNAQGEYYLTDVIAAAVADGRRVVASHPTELAEVEGINDKVQLAAMERIYQRQLAEALMRQGATLIDPLRFDQRGTISVGQDVEIDINSVFEGEVTLGDGVRIGPNCIIRNSRIGAGSQIEANSLIEDSLVGERCSIGPYARLRPQTELADEAKVGNFVETKKAKVGKGSKINHLTYVGDAVLGANVNVGAGTITCNYDGANKHLTEIGDGAFIGSNSSLVAPVKIGKGATVGAGSTVSTEVGDDELAVTRAKQRNIAGWKRPVKKS